MIFYKDHDMKTLKFRPHLVTEILEGRKTSTWRVFDEKDLTVGDQLELINKETLKVFARAEITNVREKPLGEIEEEDFKGHEKYENREAMFAEYKKYYGDRVNEETVVKMIEFNLL